MQDNLSASKGQPSVGLGLANFWVALTFMVVALVLGVYQVIERSGEHLEEREAQRARGGDARGGPMHRRPREPG